MRHLTSRLLLAVVLSATQAACTDDEDETVAPSTPSSTSPSQPASTAPATKLTRTSAPLEVMVVSAGDGVKRSRRAGIRRAAAKPVAGWMDAGFLAGRYPHTSFPHAFADWTTQAARLGRRDKAVTTNASLGRNLVGLVADARTARLYVFAVRGVIGGATARVSMRLTGERSDGTLTMFVVSGELSLTRSEHGWRIFGYALHRTALR